MRPAIHRFEHEGRRFAIDPDTCFCFECDAISWDVLEYFPHTPVNRIYHLLGEKHSRRELGEVIGELEWLRATKSILPVPSRDEIKKSLEIERGLRRVTVGLGDAAGAGDKGRRGWFGRLAGGQSGGEAGYVRKAFLLLLGRSDGQERLEFEIALPRAYGNTAELGTLLVEASRAAKLSGKRLSLIVTYPLVGDSVLETCFHGHKLSGSLVSEEGETLARRLMRGEDVTLRRLVKVARPEGDALAARVTLTPGRPVFREAIEVLWKQGFREIHLDVDGAYVAQPGLDPGAMQAELAAAARWYAERLLNQEYFKLEPIASVFWRIYEGKPLKRADPVGTNELAVDGEGYIYPSARLLGVEAFRLGHMDGEHLDQAALSAYDTMGAIAIPACQVCWARPLCGGGCAATHRALTGDIRRPDESWCDAQRRWLESAVAAFNLLSLEGVNFQRMYQNLGPGGRPSLFSLARAALGMAVMARPIEEADAPLLAHWENWTEAAYFVCSEKSVLLAAEYDREMDALHPQGLDQELMLLRKSGEPIGLLKLRPEPYPGAARAWLYLRRPEDYGAADVRRGFRTLLEEAAGAQSVRRITVTVLEAFEPELKAFLEGIGAARAGVMREAVYLHGGYHDAAIYYLNLSK